MSFKKDVLRSFILYHKITSQPRIELRIHPRRTGADALIHAPNLCNNASIIVPPTMAMSAAAVKVQVQSDDACQEDMKN